MSDSKPPIDPATEKAIQDAVSQEMARRLHTDAGGPAFPVTGTDGLFGTTYVKATGMSLRDHFAAQALSALIAAYDAANTTGDALSCIGTEHILRNVPALAYKFADAMLEARKK